MAEKKINEGSKIAMFGHKRWSREGGVEIVVKELCTRMAQKGCEVTCYNRSGHHVSGVEYDSVDETEYGIGACDTSSFFSSPFFDMYGYMNYRQLSSSMTVLQNGYTGLAVYFAFFVYLFLVGLFKSGKCEDIELHKNTIGIFYYVTYAHREIVKGNSQH